MATAFDVDIHVIGLTSHRVARVGSNLERAAKNLKGASKSLRACCAGQESSIIQFEPQLESNYDRKAFASFKAYRDEIKCSALIFKDKLFPETENSVSNLKSFIDYYDGLTFADWQESYPEIVKDAEVFAKTFDTLTSLYVSMSKSLKEKQDQTTMEEWCLQEIRNIRWLLNHKELQATTGCETAEWWALFWRLMTCQFTDLGYEKKVRSFQIDEATAREEAAKAEAAIDSMKCLVPCIATFVEALREITGFFQLLVKDVKESQHRGQRNHYNLVKQHAKEIQKGCEIFLAMAPDFISDLMCVGEPLQPVSPE